MSDEHGPQRPTTGGTGQGGEPIGSVGEEAAKLFLALSGWAKDHGAGTAGSAAGMAGQVTDALRDVNAHIATGGEDCKYCPVCQVISAVRATSPEVKAHLTVAASSLMHAAAGMLATQVPDQEKTSPVQKIDLEDWEDE
ncbi:MAG: hypothetical protein J7518_04385 [Nocardioidaceae bacterium]|nr:hypothetical protein [Nocardioidaceae bacterium]